MRKIILTLLIGLLLPATLLPAESAAVSDRKYRAEQHREVVRSEKQIRNLFKVHSIYANRHDLKGLEVLYADNYKNNDGFDKDTYFKSISATWESCTDITYNTKILSVTVNGDNASVSVEETAVGTVYESIDGLKIAGEIHSDSKGIYHLTKVNDKWYISGETALTDSSSLLYGDARFMNIEIQAPDQVGAGDDYTVTLKIDSDEKTFVIGSVNSDPVTYPSSTPKSDLRPMTQSQTLERIIRANTDNINEYAVGAAAISKIKDEGVGVNVYMAGLACIMKRVNVIPKNNFIKSED